MFARALENGNCRTCMIKKGILSTSMLPNASMLAFVVTNSFVWVE